MGRPSVATADEILDRYYPVLNHGFVALVNYMGGDAEIERAARVSYGPGTRKVTDTRKLLRYLKRHKHTTPFEMVELQFHCCMPIFVARQWIRHRTANVNEMSARYSVMPMAFYLPEEDQMRVQSPSNKQGRGEDPIEEANRLGLKRTWMENIARSTGTYATGLQMGLSREVARIGLPLSTYTQWYWKIDLHNLFHFLTLRVDSHAQWEIRQYGEVMAGMVKAVAPLAYEAWIDYDVQSARFSRDELLWLIDNLTRERATGERAEDNIPDSWSPRERAEFKQKLLPGPRRDFSLDGKEWFPAEHFETRMAELVPPVENA